MLNTSGHSDYKLRAIVVLLFNCWYAKAKNELEDFVARHCRGSSFQTFLLSQNCDTLENFLTEFKDTSLMHSLSNKLIMNRAKTSIHEIHLRLDA